MDGPADAGGEGLERARRLAAAIRARLQALLYGQEGLVDGLAMAVLAGGHVLLEGPPGVGKTLAARGLAAAVGGSFARVQCVPDLLPADITGSSVFRRETAEFEVRPGPLFRHVVLVDELNRATPRTQAALLEAMGEGQVTIDGHTLALPQPHLVLATQNPLDAEGTYPLPLSARDRFLLHLRVGYPPPEREVAMLAAEGPVGLEALAAAPGAGEAGGGVGDRGAAGPPGAGDAGTAGGAPSPEAWLAARGEVRRGVAVHAEVAAYAYRLVAATRVHPDLDVGVSPRGGLHLLAAARAAAVLRGGTFVTADDVKAAWLPVARHRVRPLPEAEVEGLDVDACLARIAEETEVPR